MAIETQNGYPSIRITAGERVLRKAAELVLYEGNPRRHGEKQMQALRRSLREFGFLRPLLIDRENRLVAGQAVLQAAMAEGMDVVPCILAEGLTAEQRRAYILADNRLLLPGGAALPPGRGAAGGGGGRGGPGAGAGTAGKRPLLSARPAPAVCGGRYVPRRSGCAYGRSEGASAPD